MSCLRPGGLELTRHALSFCQLSAQTRLLDIGCGCGESMAMIKAEYGCEVTGVEPDPRRRAAAMDANPQAEIAAAGAESLPFADAAFDIVLAECTVSLFSQPQRALAELRRVLAPQGRLLLTDVYARQEIDQQGTGMLRNLYTLAQLRALLDKGGFHVLHGEDCGQIVKTMLGQLILEHGRQQAYRMLGLDSCALKAAGAGYILLVAEAKK